MNENPRLCAECKWHVLDLRSHRCSNPVVNARNPSFLAGIEPSGEWCSTARAAGWFMPCGIKGKLWEPIASPQSLRPQSPPPILTDAIGIPAMTAKKPRKSIHRYSWVRDIPDPLRDHRLMSPQALSLPDHVDPNPATLSDPIEDQGELGSCTGNSSTTWAEINLASAGAPYTQLSRLMAYYNARVIEGSVKQDAGASIRDVVKGFFATGVATEKTWPYVVRKFATKPSAAALAEGATLAKTMSAKFTYVRLASVSDIKVSLAAGRPVVFGFSVPDYFEDDEFDNKANPWVLPLPTSRTPIIGGHAVVLIGYDDRKAVKTFRVRNSWGKWGYENSGDFFMDQAWFTPAAKGLADDMWTLQSKGV